MDKCGDYLRIHLAPRTSLSQKPTPIQFWRAVQERTGLRWNEEDVSSLVTILSKGVRFLEQRDTHDKTSVRGWLFLFERTDGEEKSFYFNKIKEKILASEKMDVNAILDFIEILKRENKEGQYDQEILTFWQRAYALFIQNSNEAIQGDREQAEKEGHKRIVSWRQSGFFESMVKTLPRLLEAAKDDPNIAKDLASKYDAVLQTLQYYFKEGLRRKNFENWGELVQNLFKNLGLAGKEEGELGPYQKFLLTLYGQFAPGAITTFLPSVLKKLLDFFTHRVIPELSRTYIGLFSLFLTVLTGNLLFILLYALMNSKLLGRLRIWGWNLSLKWERETLPLIDPKKGPLFTMKTEEYDYVFQQTSDKDWIWYLTYGYQWDKTSAPTHICHSLLQVQRRFAPNERAYLKSLGLPVPDDVEFLQIPSYAPKHVPLNLGFHELARAQSMIWMIANQHYFQNPGEVESILDDVIQEDIDSRGSLYVSQSFKGVTEAIIDTILVELHKEKPDMHRAGVALNRYKQYFLTKLQIVEECLADLSKGKINESREKFNRHLRKGKKVDYELTKKDYEEALAVAKRRFEKELNLAHLVDARMILLEEEPEQRHFGAQVLSAEIKRDFQRAGTHWVVETAKILVESDDPVIRQEGIQLIRHLVKEVDASEVSDSFYQLTQLIHQSATLSPAEKDELLNELIQDLMGHYKDFWTMWRLPHDKLKTILKMILVEGNYPKTRGTLLRALTLMVEGSTVEQGMSFEGISVSYLLRQIFEVLVESQPPILLNGTSESLQAFYQNDPEKLVALTLMHPQKLSGDIQEIDPVQLLYLKKEEILRKKEFESISDTRFLIEEFDLAKRDFEAALKEPLSKKRMSRLRQIQQYLNALYDWDLMYSLYQVDKEVSGKPEHKSVSGIHYKEAKQASDKSVLGPLLEAAISQSSDPVQKRFYWDIYISRSTPVVARLKLPKVKNVMEGNQKEFGTLPIEYLHMAFDLYLMGLKRSTYNDQQKAYLEMKFNKEVCFWPEEEQRKFLKQVMQLHARFIGREDQYPHEKHLLFQFELPTSYNLRRIFEEGVDFDEVLAWWEERIKLGDGKNKFYSYQIAHNPLWLELNMFGFGHGDSWAEESIAKKLESEDPDFFNQHYKGLLTDEDHGKSRLEVGLDQMKRLAPLFLKIHHTAQFDGLLRGAKFKKGGEFLTYVMRKRFAHLSFWQQAQIISKTKQLAGTDLANEGEILKTFMKMDGVLAVKLGQMLSERPDLIGPEYQKSLQELQNELDPIPYAEVQEPTVSALSQIGFEVIEASPIGTGSIAQAYRVQARYVGVGKPPAEVKQNEDGTYTIIVKARKPGIKERIVDAQGNEGSEMKTWRQLAEDLNRVKAQFPGLMDPVGLYEELFSILREEIDFTNEAKNYTLLKDTKEFGYPAVLFASEEVLVLSEIKGKKPNEVYKNDPEKRKVLGDYLIQAFLGEVVRGKPVHGDWNPGNILVDEESGAVHMIDPGVTFSMPPPLWNPLAKLIIYLVTRNLTPLVDQTLSLNQNKTPVDKAKLQRKLETLLMEMAQKKVKGAGVLQQLFKIMDESGIAVDSAYTRFIRAFVTVEGLARSLNPELSLESQIVGALGATPSQIDLLSEPDALVKIVERAQINARGITFGGYEKAAGEEEESDPLTEREKMEIRDLLADNPPLFGAEGIETLQYVLRGSARGRKLLKEVEKKGWKIMALSTTRVDLEFLVKTLNAERNDFNLIPIHNGLYLSEAISELVRFATAAEEIPAGVDPAEKMAHLEARGLTALWQISDEMEVWGATFKPEYPASVPLEKMRLLLIEEGEAALREALPKFVSKTRDEKINSLWKKYTQGDVALTEEEIKFFKYMILASSGELQLELQELKDFGNFFALAPLYGQSLIQKLTKIDPYQAYYFAMFVIQSLSKFREVRRKAFLFFNLNAMDSKEVSRLASNPDPRIPLTSEDWHAIHDLLYVGKANLFGDDGLSWLPDDLEMRSRLIRVLQCIKFFNKPDVAEKYQWIAAELRKRFFEEKPPSCRLYLQLLQQPDPLFDKVIEAMIGAETASDAAYRLTAAFESLLEEPSITRQRSPLRFMEEMLFYLESSFPLKAEQSRRLRERISEGKWDQVEVSYRVDPNLTPNLDGFGNPATISLSDPGFLEDQGTEHNRVLTHGGPDGKVFVLKGVGIRNNQTAMETYNRLIIPNKAEEKKDKEEKDEKKKAENVLKCAFRLGERDHYFMGGVTKEEAWGVSRMAAKLGEGMKKREGAIQGLDEKYDVNDGMLLHLAATVKPDKIPVVLEFKGELSENLESVFELGPQQGLSGRRSIRVREIVNNSEKVSERELPEGRREITFLMEPYPLFYFLGFELSKDPMAELGFAPSFAAEQRLNLFVLEDPQHRPMTNNRMGELFNALTVADPYEIYRLFSPFVQFYGYSMQFKPGAGLYQGPPQNFRALLEHYFRVVDSSGTPVLWKETLIRIFTGFAARIGSMLYLVHQQLRGVLHTRDPETNYSQFSDLNYNFLSFFDYDILGLDVDPQHRAREQWVDVAEAKKAIRKAGEMFDFTGKETELYGMKILSEYLSLVEYETEVPIERVKVEPPAVPFPRKAAPADAGIEISL